MHCPACRSELALAKAGRVELVVCARCGGVWLDIERCQRVVKGLLAEAETSLAERIGAEAARDPVRTYREASAPADATRTCPACGTALVRTALHSLVLDACREHGTWFDAGELPRVAEWFALQAAADEAEVATFLSELAEARARNRGSGGAFP